MQTNYANWNLSVKDILTVAAYSAAAGLAVGLLFYDSLAIGLVFSVIFFFTKSRYSRYLAERRRNALLLQFRDILYSVASSIAVGRSMAQALEESVEFWKNTYEENDDIMLELKGMLRKIKEGNAGDVEVLKDFAERSGLSDVEDFVCVFENCRDSGADLIQAIERSADMIGDKINLEKELRTLMAQKRFEGRIIALAPFVILLFLRLVSPQYLEPLTQSARGYLVTTCALLLIGAALLLTERINRIEI